jgi:hypothetical protein
VLEAAVLNSCQILVEGDYSGIIRPWEHYIPIRADASDFDTVAAAMRDHALVTQLTVNCRATILDSKDLRYSTKAERLIGVVAANLDQRNVQSPSVAVEAVIKRYQEEMPRRYARKWKTQNLKQNVRAALDNHPVALRAARAGLGLLRRFRPG